MTVPAPPIDATAALPFDEREAALRRMTDEQRAEWFEGLDEFTQQRLQKEDEEHMQKLASKPALTPTDETVKTDGNPDGPVDPEPEADKGIIAQLVREKIKVEQELMAANNIIAAYEEKFGTPPPYPED